MSFLSPKVLRASHECRNATKVKQKAVARDGEHSDDTSRPLSASKDEGVRQDPVHETYLTLAAQWFVDTGSATRARL